MFPADEGHVIVLSLLVSNSRFHPRLTLQMAVPTYTASTVCIARGFGAMHLRLRESRTRPPLLMDHCIETDPANIAHFIPSANGLRAPLA